MNSSQPNPPATLYSSACQASRSSASRQMALLIAHNLFSIQQTQNALMVQFSAFQAMQPLLLRPGFWQRRDTSD